MVTVWLIALATSSAARMEQAPVPSAQTPLVGLEASVSFVVLTVNVSCAGGKVRGDSERNGRSVCAGLGTIAGRDAAATDSGATTTARLKIPISNARARIEGLDIGGIPDLSDRNGGCGSTGRVLNPTPKCEDCFASVLHRAYESTRDDLRRRTARRRVRRLPNSQKARGRPETAGLSPQWQRRPICCWASGRHAGARRRAPCAGPPRDHRAAPRRRAPRGATRSRLIRVHRRC